MCSTVVSRSVELKLDTSTLPNERLFGICQMRKNTVIRTIISFDWADQSINQSIIPIVEIKQHVLPKKKLENNFKESFKRSVPQGASMSTVNTRMSVALSGFLSCHSFPQIKRN